MIRTIVLSLALAGQFYLTGQTTSPPPVLPPQATQGASAPPTASVFVEAGAAAGSNVLGGLGVAMTVANNQQIFGEIATQSGEDIAAGSLLLIGIKSNYPAVTLKSHKLAPFTIVSYGAAIESLQTSKLVAPAAGGLTASTITSIGTAAGFAQRYGAGIETAIGSYNVGAGMSVENTGGAWKGDPFVFVSRTFGGTPAKQKAGP